MIAVYAKGYATRKCAGTACSSNLSRKSSFSPFPTPLSAFLRSRELSPADAEKVLLLFRLCRDASPSLSRLSRDEIAEAVMTGKLPGRWHIKAAHFRTCDTTRFSLGT